MLFSMQILLFLYLLLALFLFISWTKIRNKALRLTSFCLSNKYTLYLAFNLTYCMLLMLYTNAVGVFLWCCTAWCISFPFLVYLPLAIYCFTTGKNWVFGNWVCLHIKIFFFFLWVLWEMSCLESLRQYFLVFIHVTLFYKWILISDVLLHLMLNKSDFHFEKWNCVSENVM